MADYAETGDKARELELMRMRADADRRAAEGNQKPVGKEKLARGLQSLNRGLFEMLLLPSDLVDAGIRLGANAMRPYYAPPMDFETPFATGAEQWREKLSESGMTLPAGEVPEGIFERGMEMLGAGALPHIGMTARGGTILQNQLTQLGRLGIIDRMAVGTASRPIAAAAGEAAASFGAATGGDIAREADAGPGTIILAELLGGFTPAAMLSATQLAPTRIIANSVHKHLLPWGKTGSRIRASNRLRSLTPDPEASAARIDPNVTDISPARQAGDPDLLALETRVLRDNADLAQEANTALVAARDKLRNDILGFYGGDKSRPRQLLIKGKQYLLDMLDVHSAQTAAAVEDAMRKMDPNISPREASLRVRKIIDDAYSVARMTEGTLWSAIDDAAPMNPQNGRAAYESIIAKRSDWDDPADIPKYLQQFFKRGEMSDALRFQLDKAGMLDANGNSLPGVMDELVRQGLIDDVIPTFNDIKAIRSRLLQDIRVERAKDAPNRNKIRILNLIANGDEAAGVKGLLDDIGESGIEGAEAARDFSRSVNNRFTRGEVGKLLNFDVTGTQRISPATTLDVMLAGRDPVRSIEQMIKADPNTAAQIQDYLKAEFLAQTGGTNRRAVTRFVDKWRRRGIFEVFPELEDQFTRYGSLDEAAQRMQMRASRVRSHANASGKSTAALYLNAEPGDEMRAILSSKRPATNARKLRARMNGDVGAEKGLRTAFLEEGFNESIEAGAFHADGTPVYSGKKFTAFLDKHRNVAKALGMTDKDWQRIESISLRMRQLEARPGSAQRKIIDDSPAAVLDLLAGYLGAQSGGRVAANNIGSSLVIAQFFSARMRNTLRNLTRTSAQQLIIDAQSDPKLYKALLTNSFAAAPRQEKAALTIQNWLVATGSVSAADLEETE